MISWALFTASLLALSPPNELVELPVDVTGFARGVAAAPIDPAATGRLDGFELQLRDHGTANVAGIGAMGAYAAMPLGPVSFFAGYEWSNLPDPQSERLSLGASVALAPALRFGVAYRALWPSVDMGFGNIVDAGFFVDPCRGVSISLGLDALNAPAFADGSVLHRTLRAGVAVRPWRGDPAITLALDSRMLVTDQPQSPSTRAVADLSPWEGVHLWGAYERTPGANTGWAGLTLDIMGAALSGTSRVDDQDNSFWDRSAISLTVRAHPAETLVRPQGRTVEIPLSGDLQVRGEGLFDGGPVIPTAVLQLDALARDASVDTVLLPISNLKVGMATVDELRAAIHRLRTAGKHVVADLQGGDTKTYMVAAAASRVRLDPVSTLNLHGFAMGSHFLAKTFDKVGLRFDAVGVGKYKSGPDPLTRDTPRPEDREVDQELLDLAYVTLTDALRQDRKLSDAKVYEVLEAGLVDAPDAIALQLVDELYPAVEAKGVPPAAQHGIAFEDTQKPWPLWGNAPVIAVVPVVGAIAPSRADNPLPGITAASKEIVPMLEEVSSDAAVKAVVVRINSPGGDVFASEQIWRAIKRAAARKPLIVSMGEVAASGGYYAAVGAHTILAEANTITGSIGIFLVKPDLSGLLEKLAVHREVYTAGENADWESVEHPMSDTDKARLQRTLKHYYAVFVGRVAAGRHLTEETVRTIAEGRVYTGARAKELGLVDTLGGLDDAIRLACERAHVPRHEAHVTIPERILSFPDVARHLVGIGAAASPLDALETDVSRRLDAFDGRPLAVMPEHFTTGAP